MAANPILKLAWLGFAYLWLSIQAGWVKLPLPYPAVKQYAHPVPAHIYPWKPAPLDKGRFKVRTKLNATRMFEGQISGSESVTMTADGRFIMLDRYGAVKEATEQGGRMVLNPKPLAHLGPGRPLGAQFDSQGNLIICDAFKGLVMLEAGTGRVVILANRVSPSSPLHPNSPVVYSNDLDIAPDGTIYFTDSVDVHPHRNAQHRNNVKHIVSIRGQPGYYDTVKGWALGMLQGLPKGRLLAYYPSNKTTHVISHELYYSNGVVLSADGTYAAVCETDRLRVLKVFLPPHPRAGLSEVLIDGLPGTPDGISRSHGDGHAFWVSLVANIPPITKWFGSALVRGLLGHIPENMRPQVPTWGAVLKVSDQGQLLQWLVDLKGETASKIPSAHEEGGRLFFGNLAGEYVSYINLADLPPDGAEEDRETLRDQLRAVPAEGDPNDMAINIAKLRGLEAHLLEEREEKAALAGEKAALAARLARLKESGADELREKAELQEALVRAEEQRLEVSRALIDFQMEANEEKQAWANTKFSLEQRILELESGRLEHHVRSEDHAALSDERDRLAGQLRAARDSEARLQRQLEAEREQSSTCQAEVKRLNQLLAALEAAAAGDASALLVDTEDAAGSSSDGLAAANGGSRAATAVAAAIRVRQTAAHSGAGAAAGGSSMVSLTEVRLQLQRQLKQQERRAAELASQLCEAQQQLEAAQSSRSVAQEAVDQVRALFKRKMEAAAREVAELAQRVALAAGDPGNLLAVGPDELLTRLVRYMDEVLQVCGDSVAEARQDADALSGRHAVLRRRLRQLYAGYRALRYRLQDEWPSGAGTAALRVPHEDAVLGGTLEDIIRADDEADRQALLRQQHKVAALEATLAGLKVRQLEWDTLGPAGAGKLSSSKQVAAGAGAGGAGSAALQLENSHLRQELDMLKARLPALGLSAGALQQQQQLRRTGSGMGQQGMEQLVAQLTQLRVENQQLRAAAAARTAGEPCGHGAAAAAAEAAGPAALRKQLKEFTLNTQLELERKLKSCESRAVMAEEQLAHLQRYMATVSVMYQREVMRLRDALQRSDPAALRAIGPPPAAGPAAQQGS